MQIKKILRVVAYAAIVAGWAYVMHATVKGNGRLEGLTEGRSLAEPVKAYYLDIDMDGQLDILVRNREGETTVFLRRYDLGCFQKLEDNVAEEQGLYNSRITDMKRRIDTEIRRFERENKGN